MRLPIFTNILVLFASISLLAGCSISYSVGESSDSISTSAESISTSLNSISASFENDDDEKAAAIAANMYAEDVAATTERFVSNQQDSEPFQQAISDIAKNHGVIDWEQEEITYIAMGKGLKRAGVDEYTISDFPYFRIVVSTSFYSLVLAGYHLSS